MQFFVQAQGIIRKYIKSFLLFNLVLHFIGIANQEHSWIHSLNRGIFCLNDTIPCTLFSHPVFNLVGYIGGYSRNGNYAEKYY